MEIKLRAQRAAEFLDKPGPASFEDEAKELCDRLGDNCCLVETSNIYEGDPLTIIRQYLDKRFTEPTDYSQQID